VVARGALSVERPQTVSKARCRLQHVDAHRDDGFLIGRLHRGQQILCCAGERNVHPQAQKVSPPSKARMPLDPEHQALINAVPRTPESQST